MLSTFRKAPDLAIIFALAAIYIVTALTHWDPLFWATGGLVLLSIAVMTPKLRGMTLWLTVAFMVIGSLLLITQRADARTWFDAAGVNATIVTLFVFAPLFGIPVRIPAYIEALRRFYETSLRSGILMFFGTQLLTMIMGVFINVGSVPVVYNLAFVKPRPGLSPFLANALNRGFAGAILWSPYFAAMALITSALSVSWSALLPYTLALSAFTLLVSLAVDWRGLRATEARSEGKTVAREDAIPPKASFPAGLSMYLGSAIVAVLALERLFELPMLLITCMAAVLFPLGWCMAKNAMATYRQGLANHVTVTLPALKKEIALFLAAGFFSGSIGSTGFGESIPKLLDRIPLPIDVTFSALTVILIVATSMIALHPIVLVTVLANGIDPASVGLTPVLLAVLLLGSWGASNSVSPASAVNNLLAGLFKKPVFELARANYKFALCMAIVLPLYLLAVK
ncbi:hypothetical protein [Cohnella yongneupensis]|uniref:Citrate transporter-like domain-containing protein n=1 Tax=Cohnella yongneupensis TaxID=425006 RepID=A0ABW0QVP3_9BACL